MTSVCQPMDYNTKGKKISFEEWFPGKELGKIHICAKCPQSSATASLNETSLTMSYTVVVNVSFLADSELEQDILASKASSPSLTPSLTTFWGMPPSGFPSWVLSSHCTWNFPLWRLASRTWTANLHIYWCFSRRWYVEQASPFSDS